MKITSHPLPDQSSDRQKQDAAGLAPELNPGRKSQSIGNGIMVLFLIGVFAYLYFRLFILPTIPIFLDEDASVYLANAQRMLNGQVMYRDFFQFTPPGTELLYWSMFKLFGPRLWIPNVAILVIGVSMAWLSVVISKRVIKGWNALLPGALFVVFALNTNASHQWFSILAVTAALALIMSSRSLPRIAGAGALCGLASCFTQHRGVMCVLAMGIFLWWEWRRSGQERQGLLSSEISLFLPFLISIGAFCAYFAWRAGLKRFLFCTVVFVLRDVPHWKAWDTWRVLITELPPIPPWHNIVIIAIRAGMYGLVATIYLLLIRRYRQESRLRSQEPWDGLMLLALVGLFLFLGVVYSPGSARVFSGSLPALILLGWFVNSQKKLDRTLARILWVGVFLAVPFATLSRQYHWKAFLNVPAGRVAILYKQPYKEFQWISQHTHPSEYYLEADNSDPYFLLGLRNPTILPFLTNTGFTLSKQVSSVIESLEKNRVRYVSWPPTFYPSTISQSGDHLGPLRQYLRAHYHVVKTFADSEQIWQRNE